MSPGEYEDLVRTRLAAVKFQLLFVTWPLISFPLTPAFCSVLKTKRAAGWLCLHSMYLYSVHALSYAMQTGSISLVSKQRGASEHPSVPQRILYNLYCWPCWGLEDCWYVLLSLWLCLHPLMIPCSCCFPGVPVALIILLTFLGRTNTLVNELSPTVFCLKVAGHQQASHSWPWATCQALCSAGRGGGVWSNIVREQFA